MAGKTFFEIILIVNKITFMDKFLETYKIKFRWLKILKEWYHFEKTRPSKTLIINIRQSQSYRLSTRGDIIF